MSNGLDKFKMGWILTLKLNLTLKVKVNCPPNNRDLNQGLLHLWSKFGDPSLNGSQVIARTSKWLTHRQTDRHTHTHTDAGNDNTGRPKLASGKNPYIWSISLLHVAYLLPDAASHNWTYSHTAALSTELSLFIQMYFSWHITHWTSSGFGTESQLNDAISFHSNFHSLTILSDEVCVSNHTTYVSVILDAFICIYTFTTS